MSNFIAWCKLVLRCSWQFNSFAKYFLTTRSFVVINYKLHFVYRRKCVKLELRMLNDKETRERKGDRVRKGADEGGPREVCKADFRIEHTLLEVSRGCWIVRGSTTNAKWKYFFLFVHRSIALLNWLVRKHLHTRDLDLILSSSRCLYGRTRVRACSCVLF